MPFPIDAALPALLAALADHPRVVLVAPPGAGKTTRVPLALLDALPRLAERSALGSLGPKQKEKREAGRIG